MLMLLLKKEPKRRPFCWSSVELMASLKNGSSFHFRLTQTRAGSFRAATMWARVSGETMPRGVLETTNLRKFLPK